MTTSPLALFHWCYTLHYISHKTKKLNTFTDHCLKQFKIVTLLLLKVVVALAVAEVFMVIN